MEVKLNIEGMHCSSCSARLEKALNNLNGINSVHVSLEEKKAFIEYNEKEISIDNIKEIIEDVGFEIK